MSNKLKIQETLLFLAMLVIAGVSFYTDDIITQKLGVASMIICSLLFLKTHQTIKSND